VYFLWFLKQYLSLIFILSLIIVCICRSLWKIHKGHFLFNANCIPVINKIIKMLCLIIPVTIRILNTNKSQSVKISKKSVVNRNLYIIGNVNFFMAANIYVVLHNTKSTNLPTICPLAPFIFCIFSLSIFLTRFPYSTFQASLVWQRVVSLVMSQGGTELQPRLLFTREYCRRYCK
jgi:hypothetical protein